MNQVLGSTNFTFKAMIVQGWPVLSVLLICSILSVAVMWDRWRVFRKAAKGMSAMLKQLEIKISLAGDWQGKDRIAHNEIARWMAPLEARISILATIASTAPFIGLLGTVIGIIRAFKAISVSLGGGPGVVANGIAEALITTAFGIAVAIPALVAYNYFSRKLDALERHLELSAADIVSGFPHR